MPGPVLDTGDMEMSTLPWPPQEILALGLEIVASAMDEAGDSASEARTPQKEKETADCPHVTREGEGPGKDGSPRGTTLCCLHVIFIVLPPPPATTSPSMFGLRLMTESFVLFCLKSRAPCCSKQYRGSVRKGEEGIRQQPLSLPTFIPLYCKCLTHTPPENRGGDGYAAHEKFAEAGGGRQKDVIVFPRRHGYKETP